MKFWRVSLPRSKTIRHVTGAGLALIASLSTVNACADEAGKAPASSPATAPVVQSSAPAAPATSVNPTQPGAPVAKPKPTGPADEPECVRTGQRVIAALARDDSGAASQFHKFYEAFKCPPLHLAQAFRCVVNLQTANPGLNNPSPEHVAHCWNDPATLPKVEALKPPKGPGGS